MTKVERILETIELVRKFRLCGPSDDPDEQTAVTARFRHLVVQLQRLAALSCQSQRDVHLEEV